MTFNLSKIDDSSKADFDRLDKELTDSDRDIDTEAEEYEDDCFDRYEQEYDNEYF